MPVTASARALMVSACQTRTVPLFQMPAPG
jgi:hypothetical protein